eukprot:10675035-Prorocentrum_lima.AAC.1
MIIDDNVHNVPTVPTEQVTNNPAVIGPPTTPKPPSPPDESTPSEPDDQDMPRKEYQNPSTPFRPTTRRDRSRS